MVVIYRRAQWTDDAKCQIRREMLAMLVGSRAGELD